MAREVKAQSRVREVDWQQVKEWDRKYLIHARYSQQEYNPEPLAGTEGAWLYRPDGSKILDFLSGYISVNIGYSHNAVQDVIAHKCHDKGVLLGGIMPNSVILAPPCTVTHEEIDIAIDALDDALREVDAMCD